MRGMQRVGAREEPTFNAVARVPRRSPLSSTIELMIPPSILQKYLLALLQK